MARSIKSLDEIKIPEAYTVEKSEYVKETDSFAITLRHKLSNARILVFSNSDDNKVFNIGFRTPPEDDTGVPHIIEHTVLCGSKNFPVKDPFVELVKGSLNTFLNATTYPDKTLYPVASCNDKDFENLMHVYMDAVLYPNIYKYEEIFKQEGWHYELEDKDLPLTYNGVVYNEMKGAYSSEERVLDCFVMSQLFPDTTYHYESGGDPKSIPDLTYEAYLDFHRKYYHPSNSYIYLYGDMDVEERLIWMDENYLKDFPAISVSSEIKKQEKFESMKQRVIAENEAAYGQEARKRHGGGAVDGSSRKLSGMTEQEWGQMQEEEKGYQAALLRAMQAGDPAGEDAQEACRLHRAWLSRCWTPELLTDEAHIQLVEMYGQDERFTAFYEKIAPGCAVFFAQAVRAFYRRK